jgi:restriction endonuclease S subunit
VPKQDFLDKGTQIIKGLEIPSNVSRWADLYKWKETAELVKEYGIWALAILSVIISRWSIYNFSEGVNILYHKVPVVQVYYLKSLSFILYVKISDFSFQKSNNLLNT